MRAREVAGPIEFPPRAECGKISLAGHLTSKDPGGNDARLVALDAASGHLCADFGTGGEINLRIGVKNISKLGYSGEYEETSPPAIIDDLVIVAQGSATTARSRSRSEQSAPSACSTSIGSYADDIRSRWRTVCCDCSGRPRQV